MAFLKMNRHIGIIVDGDGDFASLKKRFNGGYRVLKTDGPRGHTASIDQIARLSRKQVRILSAFKCAKVVVMIDFEQRPELYEEFVNRLRNAFSEIPFDVPVFVAVANTMIENWYLADIGYLSNQKAFLKDRIKQRPYEGRHGKDELKKCMKQGISYSETKHGPQLFAMLRFDIARQNSPSFDDFLRIVETRQ